MVSKSRMWGYKMEGVTYTGHEACAASIVEMADRVVFRSGPFFEKRNAEPMQAGAEVVCDFLIHNVEKRL